MNCDISTFRAKVCIARLEAVRYDLMCNRMLIKDLENQLGFVADEFKAECRECLATAYLYDKHQRDLAEVLSNSLNKFEVGAVMLDELNHRMPV